MRGGSEPSSANATCPSASRSRCIRKISPVCRFSKVRKSSTIRPRFLWPTNLWLRRSPMPLRRPRPRTRFAGCRLRQRPYPSPTVWRGKHRDAIAANSKQDRGSAGGRTAAHGDTPVFPLMFFRLERPPCAVSARVCPGRGRGRGASRSLRRTPPSPAGGRSARCALREAKEAASGSPSIRSAKRGARSMSGLTLTSPSSRPATQKVQERSNCNSIEPIISRPASRLKAMAL